MQSKATTISVLLLTFLTVQSFATDQPREKIDREQRDFCEGDQPFQKAVPIPASVVRLLMRTPEGEEALEIAENESKPLDTAKLFKASEVHLTDQNEVYLVILGSSPMAGADNGWFWIVRSPRKKPEIILSTGGNCLYVQSNETLGHRDVEMVWASAAEAVTTDFKFDGKRYKHSRETRKANNW